MKLLPLLVLSVVALPAPVLARRGQSGFSQQCFAEEYREEYIPGTVDSPGRVRTWTEQVEVPCEAPRETSRPVERERERPVDDNSCIEGSILGGLAGGALGAGLSRDEGMIIGIPLGIVGGALVGCQLDGG